MFTNHTHDEARVKELYQHIIGQVGNGTFYSNSGKKITLDADGTVFQARSLEYVESIIYRTDYAKYKAREIFPIETGGGEWAENFSYEVMDYAGEATLLNGANAGDIPIITASGKLVRNPLRTFVTSYAFSVMDIARSQHAGTQLDTNLAFAARDILERKLSDAAFNGVAESGLIGFLKNPLIPVGNVPADGNGNSTKFVDKTVNQIFRDVKALADDIMNNTNGEETLTHIMLPIQQYRLLIQPLFTGSDTSILKWLVDNIPELNGDTSRIIPVPILKGAGTAGADVMIGYTRDPRKISMLLPQDILILPPQLKDLQWKSIMRATTGSVIVRYPLSAIIREGV
jgi:hypothetical protein